MMFRWARLVFVVCAFGCGKSDRFGPALPVTSTTWKPSHVFPTQMPDEEFRQTPPPPGASVHRALRDIRETRLPNGVRFLALEQHELPFVNIRVVVGRGAGGAPVGVAAFATQMLFQGTSLRRDGVLRQAFNEMGAVYDADVSSDAVTLDVKVPAPSLRPALVRISDILRNSTFPAEDLELIRRAQLTTLDTWKTLPAVLASVTMGSILYPPGHPLHEPYAGTAESVKRLTRADLQRFHSAAFAPATTTLIVVGDFESAKLASAFETIFGGWTGVAAPLAPPPLRPQAKPRSIVIVDRPGDTQSNIRIGCVGVPRDDSDVPALRVLSAILGGSLVSRLNRNVRWTHGFSYHVDARFNFGRAAQTFAISAAVEREHTAESVKEVLRELDRIRAEPVDARELSEGRSDSVTRGWETQGDTVGALTPTAIYGDPLESFMPRILAPLEVTAEDVQRVAKAHLPTESMQIVIIGDASRIRSDLEALHLGELTVRK